MDLTDLRVERVRTLREGVRERLALYAKVYLVVPAGALAVAASVASPFLAGQSSLERTGLFSGSVAAAAAWSVHGLLGVRLQWDLAVAEPIEGIDSLIAEQGEPHVDDEEAQAD